jgi:hypothetical protein
MPVNMSSGQHSLILGIRTHPVYFAMVPAVAYYSLLYDENLICSNFTGSSYRMINQQGTLKGVEGIRPAMNVGRLLFWEMARPTEENNAKHCCSSFFIVCNLQPGSTECELRRLYI